MQDTEATDTALAKRAHYIIHSAIATKRICGNCRKTGDK